MVSDLDLLRLAEDWKSGLLVHDICKPLRDSQLDLAVRKALMWRARLILRYCKMMDVDLSRLRLNSFLERLEDK
jgi:hypothetical protein